MTAYYIYLFCTLFFSSLTLAVKDPDDDLNAPQIVERLGYPVETHYVVTQDGYILALFRIPHNQKSKSIGYPILMVHGFLASADFYLLQQNDSLPFKLSDAGFDVWLGNIRGTKYSRNHTTLSRKDPEFWDFSFEKMGQFDATSMIDYILEQTKKDSVFYVGHSQGTTVYLTMLSLSPEYNNKIKSAVLLAPVAFLKNAVCPVCSILGFLGEPSITAYTYRLGRTEFASDDGFLAMFKFICYSGHFYSFITIQLCKVFDTFLVGPSEEFSDEMVSKLTHHGLHGASLKSIVHFMQNYVTGGFSRYDYGKKNNLKEYGSERPPRIPLENVTVPVHLFFGENDYFSSKLDIMTLHSKISSETKELYSPNDGAYNHLDYVVAPSAITQSHPKVIKIFLNYLTDLS